MTAQQERQREASTHRDAPSVVRDEHSRVEEPTDSVVDALGRREGLVTALVTAASVLFLRDFGMHRCAPPCETIKSRIVTATPHSPDNPDTSAKKARNDSVQSVQRDASSVVSHGREVAAV